MIRSRGAPIRRSVRASSLASGKVWHHPPVALQVVIGSILLACVLVVFVRRRSSGEMSGTEPSEWEGWWEPVDGSPSPDLHGKVEWEPSLEGGTEIDLLVRDLALSDGEPVELVCEGHVILRATVSGGDVRATIRSADGATVPNLSRKEVELRSRDGLLARTVLEPD